MSLTGFVKEEALRLGFAFAGVTTPDPPPHLDVYRRWIADGRQGDMAYLAGRRALERREDPRRILPACRSSLSHSWPLATTSPSFWRRPCRASISSPILHLRRTFSSRAAVAFSLAPRTSFYHI